MAGPKVESYKTEGNIDAGEMLKHTGTDTAGNRIEAAISNPSGFVNEAKITCADGSKFDIRAEDAKKLLKGMREAAPDTLVGFTLSEGGPSPIAPYCKTEIASKTR